MEKRNIGFASFLISLSLMSNLYTTNAQQRNEGTLDTYIVYVKLPELAEVLTESLDLKSYYQSFLPDISLASIRPSPQIVYHYNHVVAGFAAKLTHEDVKFMEKKTGFLFARPQKILPLQTTHTPDFLGLHQNLGLWHESNYGEGVIIGVLDSGITPSHPSFHDEGLSPPPEKWKGKCEFEEYCNNKVIGARTFGNYTIEPPMDDDGHGTHTASTAAGNFVKGGNVNGEAFGTAVGMAPLAHLAIYKVCFGDGCAEIDILAAMDAAVEDGVDILSISLGGDSAPFHFDAIAVGAFTAIQKGIFVSVAAGNSGPKTSSLSNEAPWQLTVGASTSDRSIRSTAVLGNEEQYDGETVFQPDDFSQTMLPLIYAGVNNPASAVCEPGSFNNTDVKGKVVLCERGGNISRIDKGRVVKAAGGAAMIIANQKVDGYSTVAESHVLPAVHVSYAAGIKIKEYINSTVTPTAAILFKGTVVGVANAPMVASFSSRGPNLQSPGILKPDILGPGVNILAAWHESVENKTGTTSTFNIISGTSMSCPHLSGIAAILKSAHPDWSPAAIKSAMMTTADKTNLGNNSILDERLLPADVFATGAGHVNAVRAAKPGLIYDIKPDDYIPYLCGLNYTNNEVEVITNTKVNCSKMITIPEAQLNYPSFSVALDIANLTYSRTVTNVGPANSTYVSFVINPPGVEVTTKPRTLEFSEKNQKLTYEVTFRRLVAVSNTTFVQGYLVWLSVTREHFVNSPISVQLI